MSQTHGQDPACLWVPPAPGAGDGAGLGEILRTYRGVHEMTQGELAAFLGFDQSYISRLETGQRAIHDVGHLRHIAERLGMPPEELALAAGMLGPQDGSAGVGHVPPDERAAALGANQWRWRLVRQGLNRHRAPRAGRSPPRCTPTPTGWGPQQELRIRASMLSTHRGARRWLVRPDWVSPRRVSSPTWSSAGSRRMSPRRSPGASPRPRGCARCRGPVIATSATAGRLTFGYTTYFDTVDVSKAAAHELAAVWLRRCYDRAGWDELPFRWLIGDPLDLARWPLLLSISTLTIRRGGVPAVERRPGRPRGRVRPVAQRHARVQRGASRQPRARRQRQRTDRL